MKAQLSVAVHALARGLGATALARRWNARRVPILTYHGLHDGRESRHPLDNFDGIEIDVSRFERQMEHLARSYDVVCLDELARPAGHRPRAVITFDDAYVSVYELALPVLSRLGLPATMFVPTDFVSQRLPFWWDRLRVAIRDCTDPAVELEVAGQRSRWKLRTLGEKQTTMLQLAETLKGSARDRDPVIAALGGAAARFVPGREPLSVDQMRVMAGKGFQFGSHSQSHASFPELDAATALRELADSLETISSWVDAAVRWFAYPYGHFDSRSMALVAQAGYEGAVTTLPGLSGGEDPFALRRVMLGDPVSFPQFLGAIGGLRDIVRRLRAG